MSKLTPDEIAKAVEEMMTPELQALARIIEQRLPEGWGFGLLLFEFNRPQTESPLLWVSNADRADMRKVMAEFIEKSGGE